MNTVRFCAAVWLAAFALAAAAQDQSTPAKTIESLAKAFERGDAQAAARCVQGGRPNPLAKDLMARFAQDGYRFETDVTQLQIQNDRAEASVVTTVTAKSLSAPMKLRDRVALRKEAGRWLIVPVPGAKITESFVNPAAEILANPGRIENEAKKAVKAAECLTQVRRIATALMQLAAASGDRLNLTADDWQRRLKPYLGEEFSFSCTLGGPGADYTLNPQLAGIALSRIKQPSKTVLLYEGAGGRLAFRHGGKAAVAFADGHARLVSPEEAKRLIWKP